MTDPSNPVSVLTKEERAWLVRNLWEALQIPSWSKDDLIDLGKAIFAKKALKDLDEKQFARLFPLLVQIADCLGTRITAVQNPESPPAPSPLPPTSVPPAPPIAASAPTPPPPKPASVPPAPPVAASATSAPLLKPTSIPPISTPPIKIPDPPQN